MQPVKIVTHLGVIHEDKALADMNRVSGRWVLAVNSNKHIQKPVAQLNTIDKCKHNFKGIFHHIFTIIGLGDGLLKNVLPKIEHTNKYACT